MTILIIDLSSILHQISKSTLGLATSKGIPTSHIYSFVKKIPKIKELDPDLVVFCLDGGHEKRDAIDKNYKANRNKSSTASITLDIMPLIKNLPVIYCYKKGYEADDLLFTLAYKLQDSEVILFSKDYDISHSLVFYPNVRHLFTFDQEITPNALFLRFGCTPSQLPLYKAIFGDTSDNIKGVLLGRNKQKVLKSFQTSPNMKNILEQIDKKHLPKIRNNLKLVRLNIVENIRFGVGKSNIDFIRDYLNTYEIKSIAPEKLLERFPFDKKLFKLFVRSVSDA
jgi:DNA polymerase-1